MFVIIPIAITVSLIYLIVMSLKGKPVDKGTIDERESLIQRQDDSSYSTISNPSFDDAVFSHHHHDHHHTGVDNSHHHSDSHHSSHDVGNSGSTDSWSGSDSSSFDSSSTDSSSSPSIND
jgi:hypothetical protein